jgi:hypothetical protein
MTTIITYGFGVKVYVKDGYLHVEGGIGENRHHHKLHRATAGLTRLAVLSADGYVSLDATLAHRWLSLISMVKSF